MIETPGLFFLFKHHKSVLKPAEFNVVQKKKSNGKNKYISVWEDTDWWGWSSLLKKTVLPKRFPWPAEVSFITFLGNKWGRVTRASKSSR